MADYLIQNKPYEKRGRSACSAPYISIGISSLTGKKSGEVNLDARIDTGADITCIPRMYANTLGPLMIGNPLTIRGHDGTIKRVWTYRMVISMRGYPDENFAKSCRPERGVLLTDSDIGLIGMDIIGNCRKLTFDGVSHEFSLES